MAATVRVIATKALRGYRKHLAIWMDGGLASEEYVYDVPSSEVAKALELGGELEGNYSGARGDTSGPHEEET